MTADDQGRDKKERQGDEEPQREKIKAKSVSRILLEHKISRDQFDAILKEHRNIKIIKAIGKGREYLRLADYESIVKECEKARAAAADVTDQGKPTSRLIDMLEPGVEAEAAGSVAETPVDDRQNATEAVSYNWSELSEQRLVTLEQAAWALQMRSEDLVTLRARNEIHGYRDNATWKFKPAEVERVAAEMGKSIPGTTGAVIHIDGEEFRTDDLLQESTESPFFANPDDAGASDADVLGREDGTEETTDFEPNPNAELPSSESPVEIDPPAASSQSDDPIPVLEAPEDDRRFPEHMSLDSEGRTFWCNGLVLYVQPTNGDSAAEDFPRAVDLEDMRQLSSAEHFVVSSTKGTIWSASKKGVPQISCGYQLTNGSRRALARETEQRPVFSLAEQIESDPASRPDVVTEFAYSTSDDARRQVGEFNRFGQISVPDDLEVLQFKNMDFIRWGQSTDLEIERVDEANIPTTQEKTVTVDVEGMRTLLCVGENVLVLFSKSGNIYRIDLDDDSDSEPATCLYMLTQDSLDAITKKLEPPEKRDPDVEVSIENTGDLEHIDGSTTMHVVDLSGHKLHGSLTADDYLNLKKFVPSLHQLHGDIVTGQIVVFSHEKNDFVAVIDGEFIAGDTLAGLQAQRSEAESVFSGWDDDNLGFDIDDPTDGDGSGLGSDLGDLDGEESKIDLGFIPDGDGSGIHMSATGGSDLGDSDLGSDLSGDSDSIHDSSSLGDGSNLGSSDIGSDISSSDTDDDELDAMLAGNAATSDSLHDDIREQVDLDEGRDKSTSGSSTLSLGSDAGDSDLSGDSDSIHDSSSSLGGGLGSDLKIDLDDVGSDLKIDLNDGESASLSDGDSGIGSPSESPPLRMPHEVLEEIGTPYVSIGNDEDVSFVVTADGEKHTEKGRVIFKRYRIAEHVLVLNTAQGEFCNVHRRTLEIHKETAIQPTDEYLEWKRPKDAEVDRLLDAASKTSELEEKLNGEYKVLGPDDEIFFRDDENGGVDRQLSAEDFLREFGELNHDTVALHRLGRHISTLNSAEEKPPVMWHRQQVIAPTCFTALIGSDSLKLEEEPLDLGGSSVEQLELPEDADLISFEDEPERAASDASQKADDEFLLTPVEEADEASEWRDAVEITQSDAIIGYEDGLDDYKIPVSTFCSRYSVQAEEKLMIRSDGHFCVNNSDGTFNRALHAFLQADRETVGQYHPSESILGGDAPDEGAPAPVADDSDFVIGGSSATVAPESGSTPFDRVQDGTSFITDPVSVEVGGNNYTVSFNNRFFRVEDEQSGRMTAYDVRNRGFFWGRIWNGKRREIGGAEWCKSLVDGAPDYLNLTSNVGSRTSFDDSITATELTNFLNGFAQGVPVNRGTVGNFTLQRVEKGFMRRLSLDIERIPTLLKAAVGFLTAWLGTETVTNVGYNYSPTVNVVRTGSIWGDSTRDGVVQEDGSGGDQQGDQQGYGPPLDDNDSYGGDTDDTGTQSNSGTNSTQQGDSSNAPPDNSNQTGTNAQGGNNTAPALPPEAQDLQDTYDTEKEKFETLKGELQGLEGDERKAKRAEIAAQSQVMLRAKYALNEWLIKHGDISQEEKDALTEENAFIRGSR